MNEVAPIITAVAALVGAIGSIVGLLISLNNSRHLLEVKKSTNGLTTALVAVTARSAHSEGVLEGRAAEKRDPSPA